MRAAAIVTLATGALVAAEHKVTRGNDPHHESFLYTHPVTVTETETETEYDTSTVFKLAPPVTTTVTEYEYEYVPPVTTTVTEYADNLFEQWEHFEEYLASRSKEFHPEEWTASEDAYDTTSYASTIWTTVPQHITSTVWVDPTPAAKPDYAPYEDEESESETEWEDEEEEFEDIESVYEHKSHQYDTWSSSPSPSSTHSTTPTYTPSMSHKASPSTNLIPPKPSSFTTKPSPSKKPALSSKPASPSSPAAKSDASAVKGDWKGQISNTPDGTCGPKSPKHAFSCEGNSNGDCCSAYGHCGSTPVHCGQGCQSAFGKCGESAVKPAGHVAGGKTKGPPPSAHGVAKRDADNEDDEVDL